MCFANKIKLFMEVKSINYCWKLQCDLNRFVDLFRKLGLSLDIFKCQVIAFTSSHNPTMFSYLLRDFVIVLCDEFVMNLGFKLTNNLGSNSYTESICCKDFKMLEFVMRLAKDLGFESFIKILYCTFVRPNLI